MDKPNKRPYGYVFIPYPKMVSHESLPGGFVIVQSKDEEDKVRASIIGRSVPETIPDKKSEQKKENHSGKKPTFTFDE